MKECDHHGFGVEEGTLNGMMWCIDCCNGMHIVMLVPPLFMASSCNYMKLSSSCHSGFYVKGTIENWVVCVNYFIGVAVFR